MQELGAGGGAGERMLEQAFEQCISGSRALEQDVRAMRERGTRARTGVQAAIRGETERERGRARHRPPNSACMHEKQ